MPQKSIIIFLFANLYSFNLVFQKIIVSIIQNLPKVNEFQESFLVIQSLNSEGLDCLDLKQNVIIIDESN